jgi:hypothetical protein
MYNERSLDDLNSAFEQGCFFDSVVVSLAKVKAHREMSKEDIRVINRAIQFLSNAKKGFLWLNKSEVTKESQTSAHSFAVAARCLSAQKPSQNFLADIEMLLQTLRAIKQKGNVDPQQLESLTSFFDEIFKNSVGEIDYLLADEANVKGASIEFV